MNEALKQFTDQLAADLKAKFQSPEMSEYLAKMKSAGDDRTFEVVMSTADEDRQGDELDQSKWELKYYDMNPVVLWAHNYGGFPIGVVTDIKTEGDKTIATGKFAPEGVNPEADMACSLYQEKILRAVSPGYIQNDDGTRELLELSFCPVPAGRYALSLRQVSRLGVSTSDLVTKGFFYETKGAVPYADHGTEPEDTEWDGPAQVKACGDDLKKLKAICAWFDSEDPDVKSSYKLPHHNAETLKANWNGVKAAMGALKGARGGVDIPDGDKKKVYTHLAKHYKEFGKEPPEYEKAVKAEETGDECEMDDGSPGVLAEDPKNPGKLVCVPKEDKSESHKPMKKELIKAIAEEDTRHEGAVVKAIDEFKTAEPDGDDQDKALDEFTKALDDEHEEHHKAIDKAIDDNYELEDQKSVDEFRKAMDDEHVKHVKALDEHVEAMKKDWPDGDPNEPEVSEEAEKAIDEFRTKAEDELERHTKAHKEILDGNDQEPDSDDDDSEKALADAIQKAGRAISAKNREKIKAVIKSIEDHHADHEKFTHDAIAALKELSGSEEGDEGEEHKPDGKSGSAPKPKVESQSIDGSMESFDSFMLTRRVLRAVDVSVGEALSRLNEHAREKYPNRK